MALGQVLSLSTDLHKSEKNMTEAGMIFKQLYAVSEVITAPPTMIASPTAGAFVCPHLAAPSDFFLGQ